MVVTIGEVIDGVQRSSNLLIAHCHQDQKKTSLRPDVTPSKRSQAELESTFVRGWAGAVRLEWCFATGRESAVFPIPNVIAIWTACEGESTRCLGPGFCVSVLRVIASEAKKGLASLQALRFVWCRHQESNPGPTDYKSVALPTELYRRNGG